MSLVVYLRAAPSDRLIAWVGAFHKTQLPGAMVWRLNGAETVPTALRSMSSVRPTEMVASDVRRVFTGLYEFAGLQPDTVYDLSLRADADSVSLKARTLPAQVPSELGDAFNVLLVSCFHQAEDRGGMAGVVVSQFKANLKPHVTLLMGDQVYLDLPTMMNFDDDVRWLANKFEQDYVQNWAEKPGYADVLTAAPSISVPDDHEYWNNFPHGSAIVQNSWSGESQERWRTAANLMYRGFQLAEGQFGAASTLTVDPLSFFFADARSHREGDRSATITATSLTQLKQWTLDVIKRKHIGVFVTGQSLLDEATGPVKGKVADYAMADYGDYGDIMRMLATLADEGRPLLCLTGDVHWGRVVSVIDRQSQRTAVYEVISSPSSLVTTVGLDTVRNIGAAIGGIFGARNPWPRHSDPHEPPDFMAQDTFGKRFSCRKVEGKRGNHVVLLSFRRDGDGVSMDISYWPIDPYKVDTAPVYLRDIKIPGSLV